MVRNGRERRLIGKKCFADGEPYSFSRETNEKYGEIVGELAWPETDDGFLVIAGVELFEDAE
jgi:hypothetical protein